MHIHDSHSTTIHIHLAACCRIDEVHTLVGGPRGSSGRGAWTPRAGASRQVGRLLKPALARGALQCIAATTLGARPRLLLTRGHLHLACTSDPASRQESGKGTTSATMQLKSQGLGQAVRSSA
jgi:hypothetical protein